MGGTREMSRTVVLVLYAVHIITSKRYLYTMSMVEVLGTHHASKLSNEAR